MTKMSFVVFLLAALQVNDSESWINDYDERLYFTCSKENSISMISSQHDNKREDRVWDFSCKQSFDTVPECHWTTYVNGFDEKFTFSCPFNSVLSGMESYHDNKREDRRWKFYCCRVNNYCNYNCYWTSYVNYFDEAFTWQVPNLNYLAGAASYHEDKYEDRRWKFMYCMRRKC